MMAGYIRREDHPYCEGWNGWAAKDGFCNCGEEREYD